MLMITLGSKLRDMSYLSTLSYTYLIRPCVIVGDHFMSWLFVVFIFVITFLIWQHHIHAEVEFVDNMNNEIM